MPSHVAPETPGSIHEGGELGYSLSHAYGAALDNPDLLVACVIGDGEAETGPLAASWHANKFLEPGDGRRGAADPAPQRLEDREPDRARAHRRRRARRAVDAATATARSSCRATIRRSSTRSSRPRWTTPTRTYAEFQADARERGSSERPPWPAIVLRTPKGWTGPKVVDGLPVEGTWRAHQVPLAGTRENPEHLAQLEQWLRSYRPEELFDEDGRPVADVLASAPRGDAPHGRRARTRTAA